MNAAEGKEGPMNGNKPLAGDAPNPTDERLLDLLEGLDREDGRMRTAEALGVSYRTLVRAVEQRTLSGRMRDALELHLRGEGGAGDGAVQQEPQTGVLEREVEALDERLTALELEREREGDDRFDSVTELARGLDRVVVATKALADRVARLEDAEPRAYPVPMVKSGDMERPGGGVYGVVTSEPHIGEERSYGAGMPLVEEWRTLSGRRGEGGKVDQVRRRERVMELEIAMIGEHGLTLPPNTEPLHPSERERYLGWRRRQLEDIRGERRRRVALRWLRRALTLGLWWR